MLLWIKRWGEAKGNKVKRLFSPCKYPPKSGKPQAGGRVSFHFLRGVLRCRLRVMSLKQAIMYVYNNKKGLKSEKQIQCKFKFNPSWLQRGRMYFCSVEPFSTSQSGHMSFHSWDKPIPSQFMQVAIEHLLSTGCRVILDTVPAL